MITATNCRVAFVGGGGTIVEHVRAFKDLPGVELSAICNRTPAKAHAIADEFGIPSVYQSPLEMIAGAKPDLVVMAVYESAIRIVAEECLTTGVSILMEKPIGMTLSDARALSATTGKSGSQVWVGLNRRQIGSTKAALADLAADEAPRFIHVQDQQSLDVARAIGHHEDVVRNWMFANSIHLVDYVRAFGRGDVESVNVLEPWDPEHPGLVLASVRFNSGDVGLYEAQWNAPGPWACTVSTSRRRWELRPLERATFFNAGERRPNEVGTLEDDHLYKPGFRMQAQEVIQAWRGLENSAVSIAEALATTELVAQIYGIEA